MEERTKPKGYLAKYGARLLDRGYQIIPIKRGTKRPPFDDWSTLVTTKKSLRAMLEGSYAAKLDKRPFVYNGERDGIGILSAKTPLVDLDIRNEAMVRKLVEYVELNYGASPARVGLAPKTGLLFRTETPFRKVQSAFWIDPKAKPDEDGKPVKHKVEILGQGQQFVAYARHPDTGRPYEWVSGGSPATVAVDDLPELTEAQAQDIVAEFERLAREAGWQEQRSGSKALTLRGGVYDHDDPFAEDAQLVDIDEDELERKLMLVPGCDEYETWFNVGMALFHQYEGGDRGLELWHQWSSQAHNYDQAVCDEKWPTFSIEGKGRAPLTARIIIKLAKEVEAESRKEEFADIQGDLQLATDLSNLRAVCDRIKQIDFEPMLRVHLVSLVQTRYKAITNATLPVADARAMTRFESAEKKVAPKWMDGWVYCEFDETFYSITERKTLSTTAFNQAYGRKLLTPQEKLEGKSVPEQVPSQVALNLYEIPVVYDRRYVPGEEDLFWMNGVKYVNSYDGRNVPEVPEKVSSTMRKHVERVIGHFETLFEHHNDRETLINVIAWVVQNPGKRLNWAVVIQGTEMDGKTFFFRLLAALLAVENVTTIGPQAVEEKYTGWAEATQIVYVDEIKLHGHNRYDVLNRLKPLITNDLIPIRRMNVDTYMVPNMATYIMSTNYKDALPLDANDTRYFVLFSRFQSKEAVKAFKLENPSYYRELHAALSEAPGALRKWFLEREIPEDFSAEDRAPDSFAKSEMVRLSKSEEQDGFEAVMNSSPRMDLCHSLLNATALAEEMEKLGFDAPYGRAMTKLLLDNGYTKLGNVWFDGQKQLFWSKTPVRFLHEGKVDGDAVRAYAVVTL